MRRAVVAGVIAALGSTSYATAFAVSPTARSADAAAPTKIGPDKVAWYDASRATAAQPAAPMAGVGAKDLVVEGLTINTSLLPVTLPIPVIRQVTAFTALAFSLPPGTSPASLTLQLTGRNTAAIDKHLPSGITPVACPATSAFTSGMQQPASAAPTYDCSKRAVVGQLTASGKAVTFPGISRLQTGKTLSLVILPGSLGLERLVFSPPSDKVLSLLSFATTPPLTAPTVSPVPTPVATMPPDAAAPASLPPLPPVPGVTMPETQPSAPVLAPPATTPALTPAALSKPNDGRERTRALGMLLLLVAVAGWLMATERGARTAPAAELGVGRFRSTRTGPPPPI